MTALESQVINELAFEVKQFEQKFDKAHSGDLSDEAMEIRQNLCWWHGRLEILAKQPVTAAHYASDLEVNSSD